MKAWQHFSRVYTVVQDQSLARQQEVETHDKQKEKGRGNYKTTNFCGGYSSIS